jgi:hypothetical protein
MRGRGLFDDVVAGATGAWRDLLVPFGSSATAGLHLAVFKEPYLSFILDGSKTVESRFSVNGVAPYGRVASGDVILLKGSGKPVIGFCRAAHVWDYELVPDSWDEIRAKFGVALRAQDGFWESRRRARFATLIRVEQVCAAEPLAVPKRDRRGWVILTKPVDHAPELWQSSP